MLTKPADTCGGCALQHADEASYAAFKRDLLSQALRRAGVDVVAGPTAAVDVAGEVAATAASAAGIFLPPSMLPTGPMSRGRMSRWHPILCR